MFRTGLEDLLEKVAIAMPATEGISSRLRTSLSGAGKTLRRGAVIGGLGAAGALALGAGAQHGQDKKRDRLVYAPMTGGMFG